MRFFRTAIVQSPTPRSRQAAKVLQSLAIGMDWGFYLRAALDLSRVGPNSDPAFQVGQDALLATTPPAK